ncbi:alkane hydroxylase MAH1-like [Gastrolobium bilobum]|uniref:alkane hydroxylase MAH1-like n=1 Tax=Gastrolobium bilobum TaxID=150636 RepID=UPI002AB136F3|nr:alkane hydroxylase MAH1-like [Gastrolobium bilobum]
MANMFAYAQIIAAFLCFLYIFHRRRCCKYPLFIDWPFLGMLPQLLCNLSQIHDFVTNLLKRKGSTGEFTGPWFTKMNYMLTCDPINVHHILIKNFDSYVKGSEFREIFEPLGHGIFTADSDTWRYSRSLFHSLLKQRNFDVFLVNTIQKKVERSLLPILNHVQKQGIVVDLQDVFKRFTFDNICSLVLRHDPNCLSIDFPEVECEKAFTEAEECIFYRHTVPKSVWKLQNWLQIGPEKKLTEACKTFDEFIYACIVSKREELSKYNKNEMADQSHVDFLTGMMKEEKGQLHDDKFLRDESIGLFLAGRGATASALTWFFWLVATHPLVEAKILEEIKENFGDKGENKQGIFGVEEVKKLVYLHGALCEALRLFPPFPFERKKAVNADTLPSGHIINPKTIILFHLYTMGRLEEIWGKDCLEFKPERWISDRGGIVYVPSYKFISFNAGPRICLGKDMSFIQMKIVATAILCNYHIHVMEGHVATPSLSIVLLMKHGLKVKITKREI